MCTFATVRVKAESKSRARLQPPLGTSVPFFIDIHSTLIHV